ncbi:hypothetical protein RRG08_063335 [Elysia crispata]|uniref:Uncharacterized protein n=1 Tax=Elysia crispata TaxID=231223 RepID=A0AAE1B4Y8_9GAST|nr:hypothetical protein RRG08_063335 [Elysia crispata]
MPGAFGELSWEKYRNAKLRGESVYVKKTNQPRDKRLRTALPRGNLLEIVCHFDKAVFSVTKNIKVHRGKATSFDMMSSYLVLQMVLNQ